MQEFGRTGETVTLLFQRESRMLDPALSDLLGYWERIREGRVAPKRSEIDPREFRSSLEQVFILEHTRYDDVRFRLAGNRLCDQMGMDLRGMPAQSLIAPAARAFFDASLREVLSTPKVTELALETRSTDGRATTARMLLLPLCDDEGAINRVLGCLSNPTALRVSPSRYTITGVKSMRIVADQTFRKGSRVREFAEPATGFEPSPPPPLNANGPELQPLDGGCALDPMRKRKGRPNLRIVTNNQRT